MQEHDKVENKQSRYSTSRLADISLPSFEELSRLAKQNPTAFEALRSEACEQLIATAHEDIRRRLTGLQFQIDMERKRHRSPIKSCLRISQMMHESLHDLKKAIVEPEDHLEETTCKIIPFPA